MIIRAIAAIDEVVEIDTVPAPATCSVASSPLERLHLHDILQRITHIPSVPRSQSTRAATSRVVLVVHLVTS